MRKTLLKLFLAMSVPLASEARAQFVVNPPLLCLQPTLAQCQSVTYRQSACGRQTTAADATDPNSRCNTLIRAQLQPGDHTTLQDPTKLTSTGGTATQLGRLQMLQLAKRNPSATSSISAVNASRAAYAANGAAIESCDEYVYEKYLSYSQFEDATVGLNRSYRTIAATAFQTTAPGLNRALTRRDGQPQPAMSWPTGGKPKNPFIAFVPGPYPITNIIEPGERLPRVQKFDWDPQLIARLEAVRGATRGDRFVDHAAAFGELAPQTTDAQWEQAQQRLAEFDELLKARDRVWSPPLGSSFQPLLTPERYAALQAADAAIQAALIAAMNDGALDLVKKPGTNVNRLTKYDYHPIDTVRHLSNQFLTARDADLQRCLRNTANNFTAAAIPAASRANTTALEQYFANRETAVRQFATIKQALASTTTPGYFISEERSDSFDRGNGDFAIHADYRFSNRFEWPVTNNVEQYCRAKAAVHAEFNASGKLFGRNVSVIAVSADAVSQAGENVATPATFDPYVSVVGVDVWNPAAPFDISISFAHDLNTPELHAEATTVVLLGPVPVSFQAGITGQAGLKTSLDLDTSRSVADCRNDHAIRFLNARGVVEPWGYVRGNAGAALGITGIGSAGVDVDLLMVDVHAPFTANVWLGIEPTAVTTVKLGGSFSQDLRLGALDGKVTGFLSHPLGTERVEFFSWDGPRLDVKLFDVPWQYTVR